VAHEHNPVVELTIAFEGQHDNTDALLTVVVLTENPVPVVLQTQEKV